MESPNCIAENELFSVFDALGEEGEALEGLGAVDDETAGLDTFSLDLEIMTGYLVSIASDSAASSSTIIRPASKRGKR